MRKTPRDNYSIYYQFEMEIENKAIEYWMHFWVVHHSFRATTYGRLKIKVGGE